MELSPLAVYKKAVKAVSSLKYALGVAGAIATAMIAYNLASEDTKKAILAFIFVLAGMYLLLAFASAGKIDTIVQGPMIVIIWALTIMFIAGDIIARGSLRNMKSASARGAIPQQIV